MGTGVRRRKNEIEFQEIEDCIALVLINVLKLIDFYFNNKTLCSYFLIEQSTSIKSKRRAVHSNF